MRLGCLGAELALKNGDPTGALPRAEAAWKLAPGNPEVATVLAEAASRARANRFGGECRARSQGE